MRIGEEGRRRRRKRRCFVAEMSSVIAVIKKSGLFICVLLIFWAAKIQSPEKAGSK